MVRERGERGERGERDTRGKKEDEGEMRGGEGGRKGRRVREEVKGGGYLNSNIKVNETEREEVERAEGEK